MDSLIQSLITYNFRDLAIDLQHNLIYAKTCDLLTDEMKKKFDGGVLYLKMTGLNALDMYFYYDDPYKFVMITPEKKITFVSSTLTVNVDLDHFMWLCNAAIFRDRDPLTIDNLVSFEKSKSVLKAFFKKSKVKQALSLLNFINFGKDEFISTYISRKNHCLLNLERPILYLDLTVEVRGYILQNICCVFTFNANVPDISFMIPDNGHCLIYETDKVPYKPTSFMVNNLYGGGPTDYMDRLIEDVVESTGLDKINFTNLDDLMDCEDFRLVEVRNPVVTGTKQFELYKSVFETYMESGVDYNAVFNTAN